MNQQTREYIERLPKGDTQEYAQCVIDDVPVNGAVKRRIPDSARAAIRGAIAELRTLGDEVETCAWCLKDRGETSPPNVSHGICKRHADQIVVEMDAISEGTRIAEKARGEIQAMNLTAEERAKIIAEGMAQITGAKYSEK